MNRIEQIENFAREHVDVEPAHDFVHMHRVRNWALKIASGDKYPSSDMVEAAALLHDVGLARTRENRRGHGEVGAEMTYDFLTENALFATEEIDEITNAVRYHCTNRGGNGQLLDILRDADMIDCLGAIGVIRTVRYWLQKPDYDPDSVRGDTWRMTAKDFDERFDRGVAVGDTIVDYLNFQISCYDNMATETGKAIARPLLTFTRNFILQLEAEVSRMVGDQFEETKPQ